MSETQGLNKSTMYNLLREIQDVAKYASLTGSLRKGTRILIETYNRCLAAAAEGDPAVQSLFPTLLPETHGMDDVGAAAALLARYVKPEEMAQSRRGRRWLEANSHPGHQPAPPPPFGPDENEEDGEQE